MAAKSFKALVQKHGGWIDGDFARFPTPHDLAQFQKEYAALTGEAA